MKYLIAGLGNIGPEYHETRHNIGFMTVDALAAKAGVDFADGRYGFTARLALKGRQVVLATGYRRRISPWRTCWWWWTTSLWLSAPCA